MRELVLRDSAERILADIGNTHGQPAIRLEKAELIDFKNISYGNIILGSGHQLQDSGLHADILGIYGQNGSGKTSFIEALAILRTLMSGGRVTREYTSCVSAGKDSSRLAFVFSLRYPDGTIRKASYAFTLSTNEVDSDDTTSGTSFAAPQKCVISNEEFSLIWEDASRWQKIIDTATEEKSFTPETKRKLLAGTGKKSETNLTLSKMMAASESRSFIFSSSSMLIFEENAAGSVFFQVLAQLRWYARHCFFVIDTRSSGLIRLNTALPVYTTEGGLMLDVTEPMAVADTSLNALSAELTKISIVLEQMIPGLSIFLKELAPTITQKGGPSTICMLCASRNGIELPLKNESEGIRKIISVLSLIIAAFNAPGVTVAIDEFDSGIFEYLLGELLRIIEEFGKGQFIFTSHNLRPLEVINKKFLCFTTTNPNNRYIRFKNVGSTNNLRDMYFREILMGEQEEEIYHRTKRHRIVAAFMKAGSVD